MKPDGPGGRVLVVDDLAIHRRGLERLLRWGGWEVETAATGAEALAIASERRPDVVITDLEMPGMGGLELLSQLHGRDPALPVIVLTATCSANLMANAMLAGAECCLAKPLDLSWLAAALARAMRRGASESADAHQGPSSRHVEVVGHG